MPRFRFPLQPVLEQRRRAEERRQQAFAVADRRRRDCETQLRQTAEAITREQSQAREMLERSGVESPVEPGELRRQLAAAQRLRATQAADAAALAQASRLVESARELLLQAARARRAVELLRERQLEEWTHAMRKREDAQIDELAVRAARTGAGDGFASEDES